MVSRSRLEMYRSTSDREICLVVFPFLLYSGSDLWFIVSKLCKSITICHWLLLVAPSSHGFSELIGNLKFEPYF